MDAARPGVRRTWVAGAVLLLALSGCGSDSAAEEATGATIDTADPETGTAAPPPDTGGGGGGVSVSLPSAPVGGTSTPPADDPAFQCLSVNWLAGDDAAIPAGASVSLGTFTFDPAVLDVADGGCESEAPDCTGFAFTSTDLACSLPVQWNGTSFDPDVTSASANVPATATCDDDSSECVAFLEAVVNQAPAQLSVSLPFVEEPPSENGTETTGEAEPSSEEQSSDVEPPTDEGGTTTSTQE
jgi:hypothetical protein